MIDKVDFENVRRDIPGYFDGVCLTEPDSIAVIGTACIISPFPAANKLASGKNR